MVKSFSCNNSIAQLLASSANKRS